MNKQVAPLCIQPLFRCHINYDCNPLAGEWIGDTDQQYDYPQWGELNILISQAASDADPAKVADVNHYEGGAACFPYIEILAPTWGACKAIGDAVIRCIKDNGGIVDPKSCTDFNI